MLKVSKYQMKGFVTPLKQRSEVRNRRSDWRSVKGPRIRHHTLTRARVCGKAGAACGRRGQHCE
jgi:hypothetical protein